MATRRAANVCDIVGIVYKVLAENDISALDDDEDKSVWGSQLIVLHRVLSHKSTKGYEDYQDEAIVMINGSKIHNMNEVIKAISQSNEDYIVIKVKSGKKLWSETSKMQMQKPIISKSYPSMTLPLCVRVI